jgi:hypothetical protein
LVVDSHQEKFFMVVIGSQVKSFSGGPQPQKKNAIFAK